MKKKRNRHEWGTHAHTKNENNENKIKNENVAANQNK